MKVGDRPLGEVSPALQLAADMGYLPGAPPPHGVTLDVQAQRVDAADVIRMQADLRDRFRDPIVCAGVAAQWKSINDDAPNMPPELLGPAMVSALTYATSYRVEAQMTDLIVQRAASYDDLAPMSEPPRPLGFAVLERPLPSAELRGRIELIHAVSWAPAQIAFPGGNEVPGLLVTTWNDIARQADQVYTQAVAPKITDDSIYAEQVRHFGRWSLIVIRPMRFYDHVGPGQVPVGDDTLERLIEEGWEGDIAEATTNPLRYLTALFDLLGERVPAASTRTGEPTRTERKQAKREGLRPEVITVTLRPEYRPPHECQHGTGRTVGVRYPVGTPEVPGSVAFYRTIHRGTPRERKVPVHSHWRGPDDGGAPTPKVYTLAR